MPDYFGGIILCYRRIIEWVSFDLEVLETRVQYQRLPTSQEIQPIQFPVRYPTLPPSTPLLAGVGKDGLLHWPPLSYFFLAVLIEVVE